MMSSDPSSGDIIQKSLTELNQLRHEASKVFQTAAEGVKDISGEEGKEKKFLSSLKQQIDTVTSALGSVENNLSQPNSLPTALLLGSLDSDSNVETFHLYSTLSKSYKWLDKAHEYSAGAAAHLSRNSLKRSYGAVTRSRRRNPNNSQHVEPNYFNKKIEDMNKLFPDMKLSITRPGDTRLNAIVEVRLGRVLVQELEMDPYLSIDMARFPVLAAVPGEGDQPAAVTGTAIVVLLYLFIMQAAQCSHRQCDGTLV